jgi:alkylhydroperoxidase family enzyme
MVNQVRTNVRVLPAARRNRLDLLGRFSRAQLAELVAAIAWENHRARVNQALGVRPSGFSDGEFCAVPERPV